MRPPNRSRDIAREQGLGGEPLAVLTRLCAAGGPGTPNPGALEVGAVPVEQQVSTQSPCLEQPGPRLLLEAVFPELTHFQTAPLVAQGRGRGGEHVNDVNVPTHSFNRFRILASDFARETACFSGSPTAGPLYGVGAFTKRAHSPWIFLERLRWWNTQSAPCAEPWANPYSWGEGGLSILPRRAVVKMEKEGLLGQVLGICRCLLLLS